MQKNFATLGIAFVVIGVASMPAQVMAETVLNPPLVSAGDSDQGSGQGRCRRMKAWFRAKMSRPGDAQDYGLTLARGWAMSPASQPVVVFIHGFNSHTSSGKPLMEILHGAGFATGAFRYPNDQPLVDSAALLSSALAEMDRRHPDRHFALLTYSMGGLVARACIEDRDLNPGNVRQIVQVAPPNHGTRLAECAVGMDLWEHGVGRKSGGLSTRFRDSITDGLAEALDDLEPGSDFLRTLNARPRAENVRYTTFLGTGGHLPERQVAWVTDKMGDSVGWVPWVGTKARRKVDQLTSANELVKGRGDGIVAVERGRLRGVADTVLFPLDHLGMTGEEGAKELSPFVLRRLRASLPMGPPKFHP